MNKEKSISHTLFSLVCIVIFLASGNAYGRIFNTNDNVATPNDSIFYGTIYNEEEELFIHMDFVNQAITIPGQDIYGEMAGYLRTKYDSRQWMIVSAEIDKKHRTATLEVINDYGSEDLTATLVYNPKDSSYTFRQSQGTIIKFAKNRKWHKIPKEMTFKRK